MLGPSQACMSAQAMERPKELAGTSMHTAGPRNPPDVNNVGTDLIPRRAPQAQDGTDRLGQALQKVLQEDTGALIHRLHKEEMCMNCDWSRIDLEQSGRVGCSRAFWFVFSQAALGARRYLGWG